MKLHNFIRLLLMALLLFVCFLPINAAPPENPKPIGEEEFMKLFKGGAPITERRIPSYFIAKAIRWSQDAAARKEKISARLEITNSLITDGKLESSGLRTTQVKDLSPNLRHLYDANENKSSAFNFYGRSKPEAVAVIPIGISITDSHVIHGIMFVNVIFQEYVDFDGVTINKHTMFSGSTFQSVVNFTGAELGSADFAQVNFLAPANFRNTIFSVKDIFYGGVNFNGAQFHEWTFFDQAKFENKGEASSEQSESGTRIAFATFYKRVSFAGAIFSGDTWFFFSTFLDEVRFNGASIQGEISFTNCLFTKDSYFSQIKVNINAKESLLKFSGASFKSRAYFDNIEVKALSFTRLLNDSSEIQLLTGLWDDMENGTEVKGNTKLLVPPVSIEGRADFTNLNCSNANFSDVEFRNYVDFSKAKFIDYVTFNNTIFEGDLNFGGTEFPHYTRSAQNQENTDLGLFLDGSRFQKAINLKWSQVADSLNTQKQDTWRLLEEAFKQSSNLEGQNEAMYQRMLREGTEARNLEQRAINIFERGYWGYGVRPWRLIGWMLFLLAIFTYLYWTQTKEIAEGKSKWQGRRDRLQYALSFSLHNSRSLTYGYQNSRTPIFKVLTLFHAIAFIVMTFCLLQVLANVSPLLNRLVGKLLPI